MKLTHLILMFAPFVACGTKDKQSDDKASPDQVQEQEQGNSSGSNQGPQAGGTDQVPNIMDGFKGFQVELGLGSEPLMVQHKADKLVLETLPQKLSSALKVESVNGFFGTKLDEAYCNTIKAKIDSTHNTANHIFKEQARQSVRDLNNISLSSLVVPFMDTISFRDLLKLQHGLDNFQIANPFKILSVKMDIKFADDSFVKALGSEEDLKKKFLSSALSFDPISGLAGLKFSEADLGCDLMSGKAMVDFIVSGEFSHYGTPQEKLYTTTLVSVSLKFVN